MSLWCLLNQNEWFIMNEARLNEVHAYFRQTVTKDVLWQECVKIGAAWQTV